MKLICEYDQETADKLLSLHKSTPFDLLTIENVQAYTKDVNVTGKVLLTACELGLSPYDIINAAGLNRLILQPIVFEEAKRKLWIEIGKVLYIDKLLDWISNRIK